VIPSAGIEELLGSFFSLPGKWLGISARKRGDPFDPADTIAIAGAQRPPTGETITLPIHLFW
jgi:hypothetical protein